MKKEYINVRLYYTVKYGDKGLKLFEEYMSKRRVKNHKNRKKNNVPTNRLNVPRAGQMVKVPNINTIQKQISFPKKQFQINNKKKLQHASRNILPAMSIRRNKPSGEIILPIRPLRPVYKMFMTKSRRTNLVLKN